MGLLFHRRSSCFLKLALLQRIFDFKICLYFFFYIRLAHFYFVALVIFKLVKLKSRNGASSGKATVCSVRLNFF